MSSSKDKFERDFDAFLKGDDADLAALYAKLPKAEPDAKLDAAVLAMAHRALNPHLVATPPAARRSAARRHARWLPVLSAAATVVFAVGVSVRFGPQLWTERSAQIPAASGARDEGVIHVRPVDAPVPAPEPPLSPPPPNGAAVNGAPQRQEAERAAQTPAPALAASRERAASPPPPAPPVQAEKAAETAAARPDLAAPAVETHALEAQKLKKSAPAPQPFPAAPGRAAPSEMDAVERKEAIAEGAWQRLHDNEAPAPAKPAAAAKGAAADRAADTRNAAKSETTATTAAPPPRSAPQAGGAPATAPEISITSGFAPSPPASAAPPATAAERAAPPPREQAAPVGAQPADAVEPTQRDAKPQTEAREQPVEQEKQTSQNAGTLRETQGAPLPAREVPARPPALSAGTAPSAAEKASLQDKKLEQKPDFERRRAPAADHSAAASAPAAAAPARSVAAPAAAAPAPAQGAAAPSTSTPPSPAAASGPDLGGKRDDRAEDPAWETHPAAWVDAMQKMLREGREVDLKHNLRLFRQQFPHYRLPHELERVPSEPPG